MKIRESRRELREQAGGQGRHTDDDDDDEEEEELGDQAGQETLVS